MKARLVMTFETEYEMNPRDYPPGLTPEGMLQVDIDTYQNNPSNVEYILYDENGDMRDDFTIKVTGYVIKN